MIKHVEYLVTKHLKLYKMSLIDLFADSLTNYWQSQVNTIIHNITDVTSPGYTWLFLLIMIKIYRKFFL